MSDSDDDNDNAAVLNGEMIDGVLYLIDTRRGLAFSSTERNPVDDDEPLLVGSFRDGRVEPIFPYETIQIDHCETPREAYVDIVPILKRLKGDRDELRIYDPFYCDGAVKRHLEALGFDNVYNEREDFWRVAAENRMPEFDVLLTNPPFSGDNIEKLLAICLKQSKPFLLLVPNWLYTKEWFSSLGGAAREPLLVVPERRYEFHSPVHLRTVANKSQLSTSPFVTIWFCFVPLSMRDALCDDFAVAARKPRARNVFMYRNASDLPSNQKSSYDRSRKKGKKRGTPTAGTSALPMRELKKTPTTAVAAVQK
jgi:hypothetical protein